MSEVVVVAVLVARSGMEEAAEEAVSSLVEPTHAEEGCILYSVHRSLQPPLILTFIERWESAGHLERHEASDHVRGFFGQVERCFSSVDVYKLESVPLGELRKGSLKGHAGSQ